MIMALLGLLFRLSASHPIRNQASVTQLVIRPSIAALPPLRSVSKPQPSSGLRERFLAKVWRDLVAKRQQVSSLHGKQDLSAPTSVEDDGWGGARFGMVGPWDGLGRGTLGGRTGNLFSY
jgi:hypothetical protein